MQPLDAYWPAERSRATSCRSRSRRSRIQPATSTACGTRPTAARSSTARISSRRRRARGTSCSTTREPHRPRAQHRRVSLQRRPMGSDRVRSPADVLGAGRRARRRATGARSSARRRTATAMLRAARLPARHDPARRLAAIGAREQRLPAADRRGDGRRRRDVSRRQLADEGSARPRCRRRSSRSGTSRRSRRPTPRRARPAPAAGSGWSSRAIPERQRAAVEFIRDVEAPAHAARISEATGHLPVRRSVYRDFPIFSEDPGTARFGEMLVDGHARPAVPIYPAISEQLQLAIGCRRLRRRRRPRPRSTKRGAARRMTSTRASSRRGQRPPAGVDLVAWLPIAIAVVVPVAVFAPRRGSGAVSAAGCCPRSHW